MRPTANKGQSMTDDELQAFVLDLHHRSFSIDDIALQITHELGMVLKMDDVKNILQSAIVGEMNVIRAREELVLKSLCEIKRRLVDRDNSPLQKESEALYQTIHSVIGEHYGWKEAE